MSRRFSWLRRLRKLKPRTFQARLSVAFVTVIAVTLGIVSIFVVNRLDDYFTRQQNTDLDERVTTVSAFVRSITTNASRGLPVIDSDGQVARRVLDDLEDSGVRNLIADQVAQADVIVRIGLTLPVEGDRPEFLAATNGTVSMLRQAPPDPGQQRERTSVTRYVAAGPVGQQYTIEVTLADPYTYRATAINNVTGLLAAIALFALGLAVVVSAALARRFTTPIRQLTDASRALAEGDLTRRVPAAQLRAGSSELGELAVQFNTMADRLAESVELIRRDRDRSRDFLADVSHELRTPLAALRTFNQLLMEGAANDPDARGEFLESSAGQIDRLDWLAQNLLELSKLDSGLVLLDLRPDDLRSAIESATHQHDALAARRGVTVRLDLPDSPIRIRHDPPRIGQVVANLVGNAVKFTPRGGVVSVSVEPTDDGARVDVADTGVGIEPQELPHIFERFYRGSRANEARGSGSGLGLAIVRSIVDMHGGTVTVESGPRSGSRFSVHLPRDPRNVAGTPAAQQADVASAAEGDERIAAAAVAPGAPSDASHDGRPNMTETSPSDAPHVNPASAP
ncbi:MAG TPA: HAMP domain-containing sensor histidine kinase [Candidatus Limnocylindrales bacterium]|jgi:signal transduction histidine kinase|nr:HAMP domain-containing sensor histidine kinase [Candidatus Limnocylindrales bacterium]